MNTMNTAVLIAQLKNAVRDGAETHREARRLSSKLAAQVALVGRRGA